jgi:transposase-like protein
MDGEAMAAEARRLRVEEQLSVRQIQQQLGVTKVCLVEWLRGIPPPDWTRRPNAKDDLRAQAVSLRQDGWSVNDIAAELGVANSTAFQWVRHLPLDRDSDRARMKRARSKLMTDAQWPLSRSEETPGARPHTPRPPPRSVRSAIATC